MFAAAGIVVTEMSTPIRAPDFADVSESMPAVPATKATKKEKKSGLRDELGERVARPGRSRPAPRPAARNSDDA